MEAEEHKISEENITFAFTPDMDKEELSSDEGQLLFKKVMNKIQEKERENAIEKDSSEKVKKPVKATRTKKPGYSSKDRSKQARNFAKNNFSNNKKGTKAGKSYKKQMKK